MIFESLLHIDKEIRRRIEALPPVDPLTIARREFKPGEENRDIRKIVEETCASLAPLANDAVDADDAIDANSVRERMIHEYFAAGPLENLMDDAAITEIIVNGPESIWIEKCGKLQRIADRFLSALTYRNFIFRMSHEAGIQANLAHPFADGLWRHSRVHLMIPPASGEHTVITIRRHAKNPWTLDALEAAGWATPESMLALKKLVREHKNFLVVGPTGSGKTSVLNACLFEIPENERTLMIEDTSELRVPNAASAKLLTRKDAQEILREITQADLLKQALRMRPDRLVMGEIRGAEAKDLLMAFATGHTGCMGTLHAESARQALLRLEMLIQLGAAQWSLQAVRTLIHLSVQAVVVVGRTHEGVRRLEGIFKISSLEEVGFLVEKIA